MAVRYATRFRERQRRRDIAPIGGGDDGGVQEGGRWLLQSETNGWATDFLSETSRNRVALRTASVITEYAIDDFFYTTGTLHSVYTEAGVLNWSAHNLSRWSQDFDNAYWTKQANVTVTPNAVAAPDGSLTADQVDWGSAATFNGLFNATQTSAVIGLYFTYGLWIRAASGSGDIQLTDAAATAGITTATIDTNWKFVTLSEVKSNTNWSVWLRRTVDSPARIYVWGAQVNRGTLATAYLPTTTNARYGMPLDYHPDTHAVRGLLHEPQATNLCLQSAAGRPGFAWTPSAGATVVAGQPDPSGGMQALQVTTTAHSGVNIGSFANVTLGVTYTASMWCNGPVGQQIYFVMDGTTSPAMQKLITFTGAWQRVYHTYVATFTGAAYIAFETYNRSGGAHLPFGTFAIWGGQYEVGTAPTSYIPTFAATVTRQVDWVVIGPEQVNYSATAGNWWAETELLRVVAPGTDRVIGYTNNWTPLYLGNGSWLAYDGPTLSLASNNLGKARGAYTFQSADRALTANGLAPKTDTTAGINMGTPGADIVFGNTPTMISPIHGYIRRLRYLPRRVSNLELSLMTSPDAVVAGGGADLLIGETAGIAGDFTYATDNYRVAIRSGGATAYAGLSFFTQAGTSSKWVYNAAGTVVSVPVGQLALDYHPVTHAPRGLLSEPQRTNVCLRSTPPTTTGTDQWQIRGGLVVTQGQPDPTGGTGAALLNGLTGQGGVDCFFTGTAGLTANAECAPSFFLKKVTASGTLRVVEPTGGGGQWDVNLALVGSGWERITKAHPAVTVGVAFKAGATGTAGIWWFAQTGGPLSVHLWCCQIEDTVVVSSPIPTAGAAVTRAPDNISFVLPSSVIGPEYSHMVRWSNLDPAGTARFPIALIDTTGTFGDVVCWSDTGAPRGNIVDNGVTQAQLWPGPLITPPTPITCAMRVKANDFGGAIDGYLGPGDTSGTVPQGMTRGHFGGNGVWGSTALASFHVQKFIVVPRAWDNAELVAKSNIV